MKTKQKSFFENEQEQKTNYLLNTLDSINASMLKSGIYPAPESNNCNYDKEQSEALTEQICKDLNLRGRGETIFITGENFSYQIEIANVPDVLKALKRELSINWDKMYYHDKGGDQRGWEKVITPKFPNTSPNKEYWHTLKPYELATMHDSLEEFINDQDFINCRENLQTAINGLEMLKSNNPNEKAKIKGLENMVKLWQSHCDPWDKALQIAEKTDYVKIKAANEYQRINGLAENNEHQIKKYI